MSSTLPPSSWGISSRMTLVPNPNRFGGNGWELVTITTNNIAQVRRPIDIAQECAPDAPRAGGLKTNCSKPPSMSRLSNSFGKRRFAAFQRRERFSEHVLIRCQSMER
jgi:hypothetical protein